MVDLRQTPQYAKYMESIGWLVSTIERPASDRKSHAFIKKFPLIGSFIKIQRPEKLGDKEIKLIRKLSNNYKAFQIVIEPKNLNHVSRITNHGFKQSKSPFVPSKTIQIDLTNSEKQLLTEMHHKTRYNIKKGKRLKLKVKSSEDIKLFADFWQECAKKQRKMYLSQKKEIIEIHKAFGKKSHLIIVTRSKKLVSGILMIRTKEVAYYMYSASSRVGKKLFAPTINTWESIRLAKKLGCKIYDFEGIYDKRFPLKGWKGFTRFKKSFGGEIVKYPGAFTKFKFPFLKW